MIDENAAIVKLMKDYQDNGRRVAALTHAVNSRVKAINRLTGLVKENVRQVTAVAGGFRVPIEPPKRMMKRSNCGLVYEQLASQTLEPRRATSRMVARNLELDHNTPRSNGGLNHITNRVLLCGSCNRAKSNTLTLSGLRRLNKKNGWMAKN